MLNTLSPKTRRNLIRILPFGIIWFVFSLIFLISDYAAVGNFSDVPDTAIQLDLGIFIFATQIAERLGHIQYFDLLRAYYEDLSDGIITYAGEIYQYVGDEVVVSWPVDEGLKNQNCIQCFFKMKRDLRNKTDWYQQHFGLVPDFKAGFHVGAVTTGEIGALKKEIIFTGDVLNATARIQGLCNSYHVDLLLSGDLSKHLNLDSSFEVRSLGQIKLRGKEQEVELVTLG